MNAKHALVIGNTDGIGAQLTMRLLDLGYQVVGLSKSPSTIVHASHTHFVQDITDPNYRAVLNDIAVGLPAIDVCVHCAAIGEPLDLTNLAYETKVFETNLMGAVVGTEVVVGTMLKQKKGHFIGLSSIADGLISSTAPSYSASKAGIARYWEGLSLAVRPQHVNISVVRFGFVDTKMAKARRKPMMISVEQAVDLLLEIIDRPRLRVSHPRSMAIFVSLMSLRHRLLSIVRQ